MDIIIIAKNKIFFYQGISKEQAHSVFAANASRPFKVYFFAQKPLEGSPTPSMTVPKALPPVKTEIHSPSMKCNHESCTAVTASDGKFMSKEPSKLSGIEILTRMPHGNIKLGSGTYGSVYKIIYTKTTVGSVITNAGNIGNAGGVITGSAKASRRRPAAEKNTVSGVNAAMKVSNYDTGTDVDHSFIHEISVIVRLNHINIINILALGKSLNGTFFYIMPLATGTLRDFITGSSGGTGSSSGKYDRDRYTYQLLHAIQYLNSRNIIHRDLKPENILIIDDIIKISDFGLSIALSCVQNTDKSLHVATIYYRAPEVLLKLDYNENMDKWSLGCIITEIYAGQHFFYGGDVDAMLQIIFKLIQGIQRYLPDKSTITAKDVVIDGIIRDDASPIFRANLSKTTIMRELTPTGDPLQATSSSTAPLFIKKLILDLLSLNPNDRPNLIDSILEAEKAFNYSGYAEGFDGDTKKVFYTCRENLLLRDFPPTSANRENREDRDLDRFLPIYSMKEFMYKLYLYHSDYINLRVYLLALHLFIKTTDRNISEESLKLHAVACIYLSGNQLNDTNPLNIDILAELNMRGIIERAQEIFISLKGDILLATALDYFEYDVLFGIPHINGDIDFMNVLILSTILPEFATSTAKQLSQMKKDIVMKKLSDRWLDPKGAADEFQILYYKLVTGDRVSGSGFPGTGDQRIHLLDEIFSICNSFKLTDNTLHTAINIFDHFYNQIPKKENINVKAIILVCLKIAAEYNHEKTSAGDLYSFLQRKWSFLSKSDFVTQQIYIINLLGINLLPYTILEALVKIIRNNNKNYQNFALMLADSILFNSRYLTYFPDEVAKGILYIADHVVPVWSNTQSITDAPSVSVINFILQCWQDIKNKNKNNIGTLPGTLTGLFAKYNNLNDTFKGIAKNPITYYRIPTNLF